MTKVLYILGSYRSGTTLLANLLGQIDGFFSVGELWAMWREWISDNHLCGCGRPIRVCPIWAAVVSETVGQGDIGLSEARRLLALQRSTVLRAHAWSQTARFLMRNRLPATMTRYVETMAVLYRSLATEAGARVIVDSSKEPAQAALVRHVPGVDLYFVHIVRDPRGVLFSRYKQEHRNLQSVASKASAYSAASWSVGNIAAEAVIRRHGRDHGLLLTYEELVATPESALVKVAGFVEEPASGLDMGDSRTVRMRPTHTVTGNDNRFRVGDVVLQPDEAWRAGLHPIDRSVQAILTSPLLVRYGYRLHA